MITSKTLASIDPAIGPVVLKLRKAKRNEAFHAITDFTLLQFLSRSPNNRCNFFSLLAEKFVGYANRMCPPSGLQIMLRDQFFDTIAQNFCRIAVFQTFEKLCESNNFVIM